MALILGGTVDIFRTVGVGQISKPNWKGINQLSFPVGRGSIGSNILGSSISSGRPVANPVHPGPRNETLEKNLNTPQDTEGIRIRKPE